MPEAEGAETEAIKLLVDPAPFIGMALATLDALDSAHGGTLVAVGHGATSRGAKEEGSSNEETLQDVPSPKTNKIKSVSERSGRRLRRGERRGVVV